MGRSLPDHEPLLLEERQSAAIQGWPVFGADADVYVGVARDHTSLAHRAESGALGEPEDDAASIENTVDVSEMSRGHILSDVFQVVCDYTHDAQACGSEVQVVHDLIFIVHLDH